MATTNGLMKSAADILDIRSEELDESLLKLMLTCLDPDSDGSSTLPTLLLYDGLYLGVARSNFSLHGK